MPSRRLFREPIHAGDDASFFMGRVDLDHFPFIWHSHPEFELALVVRGHGRRYVGDSLEPFSEGDFCLLGSNLPHSWYTDAADGSVSSRVIQFPADAFPKLFSTAPEFRSIKRLLHRAGHGLSVSGKTRATVTRIMLEMYDYPRWTWRHLHSVLEILGTLADSNDCQPLSTTLPPISAGENGGKPIETIFALLHRPPAEIPSQAVAARSIGLSPQSFSRFFSRTVGRTYAAYVNQIRLIAACRDLIETDQSITDIAFSSGFTNLSNFNRRFLSGKGVSPRQFRTRYRQAEKT